MPTVHSVIAEADSHVYMPVLQQVAHHLIRSLNIQHYIQDNIYIETGWTSPKNTRKNHTFFTRTNTLRMIASQASYMNPIFEMQGFQFTGGHGYYGSQTTSHSYPLLIDPVSEITLYEQVLPASFTLDCTWWFLSRNVAYECIKRMMLRFTTTEFYSISLTYDYPLPKDIVIALYKLYQYKRFSTRESGYFADLLRKKLVSNLPDSVKKITFSDWLNYYAKAHFVTTRHRTGRDQELCISKTVDNAIYSLEFDIQKPEEQKTNNVPDTYTVPFTVKIQFEEASHVVFSYPVIIDDKLIEDKLIPKIRNNDTTIASTLPKFSNRLWNFAYYGTSAAHMSADGTVVCPFYDEWKMPWTDLWFRSYRPFFTCIFTADDEESGIVRIDLKEALYEDVKLTPVVLYVLREQGEESFRHDAIFNISVWRRNKEQYHGDLHLSDDLILTIKAKDIHAQKHLVLSEIVDYQYADVKWYYLIHQFQGSTYSDWTVETIASDGVVEWKTGTKETIPAWCLEKHFPEWFNNGGRNPYGSHCPIRIFRSTIRPRCTSL